MKAIYKASAVILGLALLGIIGVLAGTSNAQRVVLDPFDATTIPRGRVVGFQEFLNTLVARDPSLQAEIDDAKAGNGAPVDVDSRIAAKLSRIAFIGQIEHPNETWAIGAGLKAALKEIRGPVTLEWNDAARAFAQKITEVYPGSVAFLPIGSPGGFASGSLIAPRIIVITPPDVDAGKLSNELSNRSLGGGSLGGTDFYWTIPGTLISTSAPVQVPFIYNGQGFVRGVVNLALIIFNNNTFNGGPLQYEMFGNGSAGGSGGATSPTNPVSTQTYPPRDISAVPDSPLKQQYDNNADNILDSQEQLAAVDAWVEGVISDEEIISLLVQLPGAVDPGGGTNPGINPGTNPGTPPGQNQAPVATMTISPASGGICQEFSFNGAASIDRDGSISSYTFMFYRILENGEPAWVSGVDGPQALVTKSFRTPGAYQAVLMVKDDKQTASDLETREFTVFDDSTAVDPNDPHEPNSSGCQGSDSGKGKSKIACTVSASPAIPGQSVQITANHGTGPYKWFITKDEPEVQINGSERYTTSFDKPGTFTVTATDSQGVEASCSVKVNQVSQCGNFCNAFNPCTGGLTCGGIASAVWGSCGGPTCAPALSCAPSSGSVGVGEEVSFSSSTNLNNSAGTLTWLAPGGNPENGQGGSFTTSYSQTGTKTVTVSDTSSNTAQCKVSVNDGGDSSTEGPTAAFTLSSTQIATGQTITFDASQSRASGLLGSISTYTWDVTLASTGAKFPLAGNKIVTFTPTQPGRYSVQLVVVDQQGRNDAEIKFFEVVTADQMLACQPLQSSAKVGQRVSFKALNGRAPYEWGVNTVETSNLNQDKAVGELSLAFTKGGTFAVKVRDANSSEATCDITIEDDSGGGVQPPAKRFPVANFTISPTNGAVGDRISLDAITSYDADGFIVEYKWTINTPSAVNTEPADANKAQTSFTLLEEGLYRVTLNVLDNDNQRDLEVKSITASAAGDGNIPASAAPQSLTFVTSGGTQQTVGRGGTDLACNGKPLYQDINNNGERDFADCVNLAQSLEDAGFQGNAWAFDFACESGQTRLTLDDAHACTEILITEINRTQAQQATGGGASTTVTNRTILQRALDTIKRWLRIN